MIANKMFECIDSQWLRSTFWIDSAHPLCRLLPNNKVERWCST